MKPKTFTVIEYRCEFCNAEYKDYDDAEKCCSDIDEECMIKTIVNEYTGMYNRLIGRPFCKSTWEHKMLEYNKRCNIILSIRQAFLKRLRTFELSAKATENGAIKSFMDKTFKQIKSWNDAQQKCMWRDLNHNMQIKVDK
ncbi:MAG: hypothetical protein ACRC5M_00685 [Anaeroplasmataceae bacterium]